MRIGSLTVVGTGIQLGSHLSAAARAWITKSEVVFFHVADVLTAEWLVTLNKEARPLPVNREAKRRSEVHAGMVPPIMAELRAGKRVCVVFYVHPGVFTDPTFRLLGAAEKAGFKTRLMPAISADACLYADLRVDPAKHGSQSFEATDFLLRDRRFDPRAHLILWQVAMIGNLGFFDPGKTRRGLEELVTRLLRDYPEDHEVVVYVAAIYPTRRPMILRVPLRRLAEAEMPEAATLYVPPRGTAPMNASMAQRLGIELPSDHAAPPS